MKHKKIRYVLLAVIALVCVSAPFVYAYKEVTALAATNVGNTPQINYKNYDEVISDAEKTKKELEEKAASVKAEIEALSTEYDSISAYVQELDEKQNALSAQVLQINLKLAELEAEKAITEEKLAEAQREMDEQYETMSARIKYVYENGETSYWDILVNSSSFFDLLNRVEYVSEISEYDDKLFTDFQAAHKKVTEYNDALAAQLDTLSTVEATYQVCLDYSDALQQAKLDALAECAEKLGVAEELYEDYGLLIEAEEMTIEEALKAQQAEIDKGLANGDEGPVSGLTGTGSSSVSGITQTDNTGIDQMIWPLPGHPTVTSYFGYRQSPGPGASTYHKGIDIYGPYGTPIVAAVAGTVIGATYSNSMGNYVMIDHGNGVKTVYMHCSSLATYTGAYVKQGQVIGYVGNTGISYGNHLHFGVNIDGTYKNPLNYVAY